MSRTVEKGIHGEISFLLYQWTFSPLDIPSLGIEPATSTAFIIDANGKELANGIARTEDNWMTENFVDFSATLTFVKPTTTKGTLLLKKDNPSGLAENEKTLEVPIIF